MPGDEAPEKIHTLPFVPPVFGLHRIYIPNSEFLRPKFSLLSMAHVGIIPMKQRLGQSLIGWVSPHLKCTIILYGVCLLKLLQTSLKCLSLLVYAQGGGGLYSSQFKSQSDFMIRLRDIVTEC